MSSVSIDKAIITNDEALRAKYGAAGVAQIATAITALIAADTARGLRSQLFHIDDATEMAAVGGSPVIAPADEQGAKNAIDAICNALTPDYLLLLDGPDVVPHIALDPIPGLADSDRSVPSDLPYACSAPFSRDAADFVGVDRVVGRLPAAEGADEPALLVSFIQNAIGHRPKPKSQYTKYFGMSADVWSISTQLSLTAAFGSKTGLQLSPPAAHPGINGLLGQPSHFVNCHGSNMDPRFYGQKGIKFPVAMESRPIASRASGGDTVVTAECCFGAQLYNHRLSGIDEPICIAYLRSGAIAFLGSTNIAYGPASASGQADLICQYFWAGILVGASAGRALLQARQNFVRTQIMSDPTNLKTLAQFLLLGDPSVCPVETPPSKGLDVNALPENADAAGVGQRKQRRAALASAGRSLGKAASLPGRPVKDGDRQAVERLRDLASSKGYGTPVVLSVTGGAEFRRSIKALRQRRRIVVAVDKDARPTTDEPTPPLPFTRVFVGHIVDGTITSVSECESR
ncbi:C25 family cysteine peptidase [Mesorhizobium sp.]|uniref:C25 family cysteine peptidase n=1 Tax=Mesorhizobium sp. TaxID=1871066 RepID=UPI000FE4A1D0|nr:C25 family cysteine peptidase [Mesorhizobium sp.]RWM18289.1 MAG: hypothetical protein EOR74_32930 [Mesorhizobium sp.]RWM37231.1 MAG: hypothetical protein EOR75_20160 [Mesorhizobium sp.]TJV50884.1 MAG: hypothetical protein E5Y01_17605 [Mesorhizobium sp.]